MNISCLPYNYEELHTLSAEININFDIIGITGTRLSTNQKALNNIDIETYVIKHTITDASCVWDLLYIKGGITYKVRNNLKITKSKELESNFVKIQTNHKPKNVILGCIYWHPCVDWAEFNGLYLQNLLDTLAFENKDNFLKREFSINITQYDNNKEYQEFLDKMHSKFLLPDISSLSRVTPRSQTLIDKIISNKIEVESFSGNITTIISDYCAQIVSLKKQQFT